ncbi:hypothetical protein ABEB36_000950 [Hypothenemus hampei]|uniref:Uncharacterized protein n=1 Tax=Hypothenemus hampei TaxID=57062 RepID=A0ABD1FDS9_HYPHA
MEEVCSLSPESDKLSPGDPLAKTAALRVARDQSFETLRDANINNLFFQICTRNRMAIKKITNQAGTIMRDRRSGGEKTSSFPPVFRTVVFGNVPGEIRERPAAATAATAQALSNALLKEYHQRAGGSDAE